MNKRIGLLSLILFGISLLWAMKPIWAGYKIRPWSIGARDSYMAKLTSEGVTIAVEPLFTNALAARVFDKNDIVTRGIMPVAVLVFNDNSFPIEIDGSSIEVIRGEEHIQTLAPNEVVYRLFSKNKSWEDQPIPKLSRSGLNKDALEDFSRKFLMRKTIAAHDAGGGFLYMHLHEFKDPAVYLSKAVVYIPRVYRQDTGARLIFFEIELNAAIGQNPR